MNPERLMEMAWEYKIAADPAENKHFRKCGRTLAAAVTLGRQEVFVAQGGGMSLKFERCGLPDAAIHGHVVYAHCHGKHPSLMFRPVPEANIMIRCVLVDAVTNAVRVIVSHSTGERMFDVMANIHTYTRFGSLMKSVRQIMLEHDMISDNMTVNVIRNGEAVKKPYATQIQNVFDMEGGISPPGLERFAQFMGVANTVTKPVPKAKSRPKAKAQQQKATAKPKAKGKSKVKAGI